MFPCRVSWKNYLIFLGKVCIFFEHSILPIMTILLNGTFFVQNKCCAVGGILWNFHVVFRELSQLHNPGIEHYMRIHQDFVATQNPILPRLLMKLSENKWNYLMISGGFWKHLKTNENIWKYFDNFLKTNEIIWNYPMISGIVWNCHI